MRFAVNEWRISNDKMCTLAVCQSDRFYAVWWISAETFLTENMNF